MKESNQRSKPKIRSNERRVKFPWWAWAFILAVGLSALVVWISRRRAAREQAIFLKPRPSPRLSIPHTPVASVAPVIQEVPLPVRRAP